MAAAISASVRPLPISSCTDGMSMPYTFGKRTGGAADVAVLDEALAVRQVERVGHLQGRGARGVGDRDHHVDIVVGPDALDLAGEFLARAQTRLLRVCARQPSAR